MKKRKKNLESRDLGYASFHCKRCDKNFDISWSVIFSIQEMTHGYVGFSQQEEYIACPVCGEKANESEEYDEELPFY